MIRRLRVTILADNFASAPEALAEHGLSMLIEADGRRILFDTGQGRVLPENWKTFGTPGARLDALVLSHGHYDHTGGIAALAAFSPPQAIFVHPAALEQKFTRRGKEKPRSIGIPPDSREALFATRGSIVWTRKPAEVAPGVWCTGEIPRETPPAGPSPFFLDEQGKTADPLRDDQALFIETRNGLVVLCGCAHAGVVNTVEHVCRLAGKQEILALAGGLHLARASIALLDETAEVLRRRNVKMLAPCHCTGLGAHAYLRSQFGSLVRDAGAGSSFEFE
jgi:7,8-dihydropterin-6-yl-methyl-4-(beta-D-ribofuranosyl)aminobenzene 5'-phosphate synthase